MSTSFEPAAIVVAQAAGDRLSAACNSRFQALVRFLHPWAPSAPGYSRSRAARLGAGRSDLGDYFPHTC